MINIIAAETETHIEQARTLAREYVGWLLDSIRVYYPQVDTTIFAAEHKYDDVSKKIPGDNMSPDGRLLLALDGDHAAGVIALGKLSDTICEMRTLFVRPAYRGTGLGKKLAQAVIDQARQIGYDTMRLDTLGFLDSALGLYRSLGFRSIEPYAEVSEAIKPYVHFLELDLSQP